MRRDRASPGRPRRAAARADPLRHDDAPAGRGAARGGGAAGATSPRGSSGPGADVRVWEPDVAPLAGHPMVPGRLLVRRAGRSSPRASPAPAAAATLLLNGHIDVVSVEPRDRWAHDPFAAVVADGRVHGRGSCDMKGGVACMVLAAEVLAALGVRLAGDLIVNTVIGGGVDGRRRARDGAGAAGRRRDRARAGRPRRLDRLPRQPAADDHRRGPRRATRASRRGTPTTAARSTRSRRWRSCSRPCGGCARSGRCARATPTSRRPSRADDRRRRRVARQLPGVVPARLPHRVPARVGRRARLRQPRRARVRGLDRARGGDRPVAARAPAARSSGWSAACRRPRSPADDPIVQIALARDAGDRARERARRPRQLARRRDADRRGRASRRSASGRATSTSRTRPRSRCRSPISSTARRRSPSPRCASAASPRPQATVASTRCELLDHGLLGLQHRGAAVGTGADRVLDPVVVRAAEHDLIRAGRDRRRRRSRRCAPC